MSNKCRTSAPFCAKISNVNMCECNIICEKRWCGFEWLDSINIRKINMKIFIVCYFVKIWKIFYVMFTGIKFAILIHWLILANLIRKKSEFDRATNFHCVKESQCKNFENFFLILFAIGRLYNFQITPIETVFQRIINIYARQHNVHNLTFCDSIHIVKSNLCAFYDFQVLLKKKTNFFLLPNSREANTIFFPQNPRLSTKKEKKTEFQKNIKSANLSNLSE